MEKGAADVSLKSAMAAAGNEVPPPVLAPLPGWRCVSRAVIRAFGEEGPVDLAALRTEHGVALIAFLAPGEEASPDEARNALRAMLHDEGFEEQFAGELPIVALTVAYGDRAHLAETVERAFRGAPAPISDDITPEQMRDHVQCVIRDTARHAPRRDYYLVEGARSWTVSDQLTKKEIILQGMGWGHMPTFMIAEELRDGRLLSIAGKHLRGGVGKVVAARRRDRPHGPVANRLWHFVRQQAPGLRASIRKRDWRRSRQGRRSRTRFGRTRHRSTTSR